MYFSSLILRNVQARETAKKRAHSALLILFSCSFWLLSALAQSGLTHDSVKQRGYVNCGIHSSLPGLSIRDAGSWAGLEVDFCRAVAAAVLGDSQRVKFVELPISLGYTSLQSGEIDLLMRHSDWNLSIESTLGLVFGGALYYEYKTFLVGTESSIMVAGDLEGATVCVDDSRDDQVHLENYTRKHKITLDIKTMPSLGSAAKSFELDQCKALVADASELFAARLSMGPENPTRTLDQAIHIRATGPVLRQNDTQWHMIVRWVLQILLLAEQLDIEGDQKNQESVELLATTGFKGVSWGLRANWHQNIISQVGNYEQLFHRNLGNNSPLKMPRVFNRLSVNGGLHVLPLLD